MSFYVVSLLETTAATYSAIRSTATVKDLIRLDLAEPYPSREGRWGVRLTHAQSFAQSQ
jgi:hypothetical protein